jgi:outer membrane protein W
MIKRISLIAVVAMLALVVAPVQAQDDESITFRFGGKFGWHFLQSKPLSDLVDNNWIAGGDFTVWFPTGLGVGVDVKFSTKDQDAADIPDYDIDFKWTQVPICLNAYYKLPVASDSEVIPYIGGGLAIVYTDVTATENGVDTDSNDTSAGVNFIGGVEIAKRFFVEGQYIWSESTFEEIPLLKADDEDKINVGGFNLTFGVRF